MKRIFLGFAFVYSTVLFAQQELSVLSYNLQNLFDTVHDKGKMDFTYLPKSVKDQSPEVQEYCRGEQNENYRRECFELDWNDNVVKAKVKNLGKVIKEFGNGKGPDILVLMEIENANVLSILNKGALADLGYQYQSLVEGPDRRGIDVAVISRYPISSAKGHLVTEKTRLVLEANIKVKNKIVTVFANHWPSQNSGPEERIKASKVLLKAGREAAAKGNIVLAFGDFNTLPTESPNAIDDFLTRKPRTGGYFIDAIKERNQSGAPRMHEGTHWYQGHWHHLDRVFVFSESVSSGAISPDWRSLNVVKPDYVLKDLRWTNYETGEVKIHRVPKRFDAVSLEGFSDHLALGFKFVVNN